MSDFQINHTETSQVDNVSLQAHTKAISGYRETINEVVESGEYNEPESALNLPDDDQITEDIIAAARSLLHSQNPDVVVVVGMGGSSRGTKAVYELTKSRLSSEMYFLDSVSPRRLSRIVTDIANTAESIDSCAICLVSKSGTTTETIANFNLLIKQLVDTGFSRPDVYEQTVAITDSGSQLEAVAEPHNIRTVSIPEQVGGRFSVLSAVGVLPLLLAGVDVDSFRSGAADMRNACLSGRTASDPAATMAAILYEHSQNARRIINHFFFNPEARVLGRWSAQLFAESLGKKRNQQGEPVYAGLYPSTTIGPDDLHSLLQLQLGGPKNFTSVIIRETDREPDFDLSVSEKGLLVDKLSYLDGVQLGDIHAALARATTQAFAEANRPFVEIVVPKLNEQRIGQFMMLEQLVVMYQAELLNVNAFDQPEVEGYKETTREILMS